MPPSRRKFLHTCGSTALLASLRPKLNADFLHPLQAAEENLDAARLAADPLRPQFHLLPAKGWMNDPNGPIYWKNQYHMFFQYNPNAVVWGDMHWNHAVSDDLIHWQHLPIALAPTPGWDDADGCFTGSTIDDHGTATILYTGVKACATDRATLNDGAHTFREVQCLATSSDPQLRTWTKWRTPVVEPPQDAQLTGFRDPFLWRDSDTWYLGVGSGVRKQGGQVLLYRSKNLRLWEFLHPLATGQWTGNESKNPVDSGEMWECPDFFQLGSKLVLLYATAGKVIWEIGELDPNELVFRSQRQGILDYGAYYAQKTQLDAGGSRILWGWIPERRPEAEFSAAGWAGCMALPRLLSVSADGDLEMRLAPETHSLRAKASLIPPSSASPALRAAAARKIEIENLMGEFVWQSKTPSSTFALADRTGSWYSLKIDDAPDASKLTVNGKSVDLPASTQTGADFHSFHLFIDASVAELICDDKHAITTRIYRKPDGPLHLSIGAPDLANIASLTAWQLKAISPNRLTS